MTSPRTGLLAVAAGLLAAGLAGPSRAADAAAEAREAVRKADVAFCEALKAQDRSLFADFVAPETRFFHGGDPTGKRDEVLKEWEPFFAENGPRLTWAPVHVEAAASGDLGYSTGRYEMTAKNPDGSSRTGVGWYVTIWRRGEDGRFRAVLDIGTPPSPRKP